MEIVKIYKNAKVLALISRDTGTEPRLDQYSHERQRGKAPEERARRRLGHKYVNTFRRGSRVSKHFASGILNYDTASEFRLETTCTVHKYCIIHVVLTCARTHMSQDHLN